jgi:HSP20 family protein
MRLIRRSNNPAADLFSEFDRLFRQSWRGVPAVGARNGAREFNVYEAEDAWHLRAELPGFRKEDLDITLEDDVLKVSAERTDDEHALVGSFSQSLRLPDEVARAGITAGLEDGILDIALPKSAPAESKTLRIDVN